MPFDRWQRPGTGVTVKSLHSFSIKFKGKGGWIHADMKCKPNDGPVKCDVTTTSGITGWLQTKQTASSYKTERDIFAYISAKIKKKMSICFSADCNHRCLRERCKFFRFPFITPLVELYKQLSGCPDLRAFFPRFKSLLSSSVSLLCNKRSTSMSHSR